MESKLKLAHRNRDQICGCQRQSVGFLGASDGKESACNVGDLGSIPGLGRFPAEGNGYHSSILAWRIPMDRGAWKATVHGVTKVRYD